MTKPTLTTREAISRNERTRLARYATFSDTAAQRRHHEDEHPYRTAFQRDCDRIIHCSAFRRLAHKTQVFVQGVKDYSRTRLTHTMEVVQIARTLARALAVNEDLAEAAALAHDLGHPPFGHGGEATLNELMARHGGFEHNAHSLRIVDYLEHPYPDFRGLNLCYATRLCMAKHQSPHDHPTAAAEFTERQIPLEGQIADLADAIAYTAHDLDDALTAELIDEDQLNDIALYQQSRQRVQQQYGDINQHHRQIRCVKAVIELLVSDALTQTAENLAQAIPANVAAICQMPHRLVTLSTDRQRQVDDLAAFFTQHVFRHQNIAEPERQAQQTLRELFTTYLAQPELLPPRYQNRINEQGPHRVICDYLAGTTDHFCRQLHQNQGRTN